MSIYSHDNNNPEDDKRYLQMLFNKYSEQAWDEKGQKIENLKVLSKKGATKMSRDVLASWNKLNKEEIDSYI